MRELNDPTASFDVIARELRTNLIARLERVLGGVLKNATDEHLRDAAYCVIGQCTFYRHARQYLERHEPRAIHSSEDIEAIADRVYRFSLGALNASEPGTPQRTKGRIER